MIRNRLVTATLAAMMMVIAVGSPAAYADQEQPIERIQNSVNRTFEKAGLPVVPWHNIKTDDAPLVLATDPRLPDDHQIKVDATPRKELDAANRPLYQLFFTGVTATMYAQVELHGIKFNPFSQRARAQQYCYAGVGFKDYVETHNVSRVDFDQFDLAELHDQNLTAYENEILDQVFLFGRYGGMDICNEMLGQDAHLMRKK
jgi:hypothetical protein